MNATELTIGQVLARIYDAALEEYGDPDLAAVVTSTVLNELLASPVEDRQREAA
jgi:hypothetical protein